MDLVRNVEALRSFDARDTRLIKTHSQVERISVYRFAAKLMATDVIAVYLSGLLPILVYDGIEPATLDRYVPVLWIAPFLYLIMLWLLGAYRMERILDWQWTIWKAVASLLAMFAVLVLCGVAAKTTGEYSRVWFFSWLALSIFLVVLMRTTLLALAEAKLARGACLQRGLIINCGSNTVTGDQLAVETSSRIRAVGSITVPNLTSVPDLEPYFRQLSPDVVIISLPWSQVDTAMRELRVLSQYAIDILVLPQDNDGLQRALGLRRLGGKTLLQIAEPPLREWDVILKRIEDVTIASLALLLISPLLALTALAIKLESRGPVLFKQMRAGFNGQMIEVWKFRSMYVEGTDANATRQTSKGDPRVTFVGRFIRRASIDELPQFWNVIQGRMSVVGPRPHALATSAEGKALDLLVEEYIARHRVKPGITGWAQINGARGELCSREQVQRRVDYDLHYIRNWSVLFDIKIILMTAVRVIYDPHAY